MSRILLVDCYQDEPACLGVPPYLSPRIRYAAGAALELGMDLTYITVDRLREIARSLLKGREISVDETERMKRSFRDFLHFAKGCTDNTHVLVYAGVVIPGKYLRAVPPSFRELANIPNALRTLMPKSSRGPSIIALSGAVARFDFVSREGKRWEKKLRAEYDRIIPETPASALYSLMGEGKNKRNLVDEANRFGSKGSFVVKQHPDHPAPLICEIETYQGCVRYGTGGCGFCSQSNYGRPVFRDAEAIINEMTALGREGITRFRLGGQSCFYSYGTEELGESETPTPNPIAVKGLLAGIRNDVKKIEVLHIDNVNPAVVAAHPVESTEITRAIVKYCTAGNVAAFGLESADPKVFEANNLNCTPEMALEAVRLINRYGKARGDNGMPKFLPGINFLGGLKGESTATYGYNMDFLHRLIEDDLLVRRINIRMVTAHGYGGIRKKMRSAYVKFRERVRDEIDPVLLERIIPRGTILRDVYLEKHDGKNTFGRQVGTYPILVGLSYSLSLNNFINAAVISHSSRSVTAVESPFPINTCTLRALGSLPGIGKKRAARIASARPVKDGSMLGDILGDRGLAEEIEMVAGGIDYSC